MKYLLLILFIPSVLLMDDWGKTGHRVVGEVAERHLADPVKTIVRDILDGESLSTAANWPDEMRSNPDFRPMDKWHYVNLPLDKEYEDVHIEQDNIVSIIYKCVEVLKDTTASRQDKKFYLKYLVHLLGDIHQPMHIGRSEDYGGSKINITFKGRKGTPTNTNLHVLWDTNLIDDYKMSYTEWSTHLIDRYQHITVVQGTPEDWSRESHVYTRDIYEKTPEGSVLSYDYVYKYHPIVENRLYLAGLRLAGILNDIFTPAL